MEINTKFTTWRPAEGGSQICSGMIYGAGDIGPNGRTKQFNVQIGEMGGSWVVAARVLTDKWDRIKKSGGKTTRHATALSRSEALGLLPSLLHDLALDVETAYANDGTTRMPGSLTKAVPCEVESVVTH